VKGATTDDERERAADGAVALWRGAWGLGRPGCEAVLGPLVAGPSATRLVAQRGAAWAGERWDVELGFEDEGLWQLTLRAEAGPAALSPEVLAAALEALGAAEGCGWQRLDEGYLRVERGETRLTADLLEGTLVAEELEA